MNSMIFMHFFIVLGMHNVNLLSSIEFFNSREFSDVFQSIYHNNLDFKNDYIFFLNLPYFFKKPFIFKDYIYMEN